MSPLDSPERVTNRQSGTFFPVGILLVTTGDDTSLLVLLLVHQSSPVQERFQLIND